jgi:hypothetical protein
MIRSSDIRKKERKRKKRKPRISTSVYQIKKKEKESDRRIFVLNKQLKNQSIDLPFSSLS